jgi:hypothetical protein
MRHTIKQGVIPAPVEMPVNKTITIYHCQSLYLQMIAADATQKRVFLWKTLAR